MMSRNRALRRRAIAALLLLLSLAMLTLFFREQAGGFAHRSQETGLRIIAPLQRGSGRAAKPFRDVWHWTGGLFKARADNKRLNQEVDELRLAVARDAALELENQQLRAELKITRSPVYPDGMTLVPARVIARSTNVWYSTVTIDVGRNSNVQLYDAVVNGEGLVGRVTAVTSDVCQVTLITDQQSYVDAKVVPGGAQGLVAGSVIGDVELQYVDKSEAVKVGDNVVTSGLRDSIFVQGIPIGVVESVAKQDVELYQKVTIRPLVDFHKLDLVMVVER